MHDEETLKREILELECKKEQMAEIIEKAERNKNNQSNVFDLSGILKRDRILGVVGNPNEAKSCLSLWALIQLKKKVRNTKIYVLGAEKRVWDYLRKEGINIIENKEDILDLNEEITDSIILIDEFSDLFSVHSQDKQMNKIKRFFNRIHHLNDWVIICSAESGFWNKLMCSFPGNFLIKSIEYEALVNGTTLKRKVLGIPSTSDYRLDCKKDTFFVLSNCGLTRKYTFPYIPELDTKKDNINPFNKEIYEINCEQKIVKEKVIDLVKEGEK